MTGGLTTISGSPVSSETSAEDLRADEKITAMRSRAERFGSTLKLLRDAHPFDLAAFLDCAKSVASDLDSLLTELQQRTKERDVAIRRAERAEALHASAYIESDVPRQRSMEPTEEW